MSYADFEKREHAKRVNHFVRFINAHNHKATIADAIEVFGFVEKDARPIYEEAMSKAVSG